MELIRPQSDIHLLENRDQRKLQLFQGIQFDELKASHQKNSLFIDILDVRFLVHLYGCNTKKALEFLDGHYSFYSNSNNQNKADAEIDFFILDGPEGDMDHDNWLNPEPMCWYIPKGDSQFYLIQRDFIALLNPDLSYAQVVSPRIGIENPNSMENLIVMLNSFLQIKKGTLVTHAACVEKNGEAWVFYGDSGAGKSTLAEQCYYQDGLKVMSGDQIYLRKKGDQLFAHSATPRILEFPKGHPGLLLGARPVKALFHLVQKGKFEFSQLSQVQILPLLAHETMSYFAPFPATSEYLKVLMDIVNSDGINLGQMSYPKGKSFWTFLESKLSDL